MKKLRILIRPKKVIPKGYVICRFVESSEITGIKITDVLLKIKIGDTVHFKDNSFLEKCKENAGIKERPNNKAGIVIGLDSKAYSIYDWLNMKRKYYMPIVVKMDNGDVIHCGEVNIKVFP